LTSGAFFSLSWISIPTKPVLFSIFRHLLSQGIYRGGRRSKTKIHPPLAQKKFLTSGISVFNIKIISETERKSQFFAVRTGKRDWETAWEAKTLRGEGVGLTAKS
jgi:hypothetical protein